MYLSDGIRCPGAYAGWRGGTYEAMGRPDGRVRLCPAEAGDRSGAPRGSRDVIADVPVADLQWWVGVSVDARWQGLDVSVMKVDADGRAWGYLADNFTTEHVAEAEAQGGLIEKVDRGEVHIGVPFERLEAVQESVTDLKERWLARERVRPSPEEAERRRAEQRARDEARVAQVQAEHDARRRQVLDAIATCVRTFVAPGWEKVRIEATIVGYDRRVRVVVSDGDRDRSVLTPDGLPELLRSLKHLDRRIGEGTWLSATLELDRAGSWHIDLNMDREPHVQPPVAADDYNAELFVYQRDYAHVPPWLRTVPSA